MKPLYAPPFKTVNIHPSALPKYRGSVPTLWALKNQDTETAVTFMLLDSRMDGGQILAQHTVHIISEDDSITLENKCDRVIQQNLVQDLLSYLHGHTVPVHQNESESSKTAKYYDYMSIDWQNGTAREIVNKINLYPHLWPLDCCHTSHNTRIIKIKKMQPFSSFIPQSVIAFNTPGRYGVVGNHLFVKTKDSFVSCRLFKDLTFKDSFYFFRNPHGKLG